MKKNLLKVLLLSSTMTMVMAGCGGNQNSNEPVSEQPVSEVESQSEVISQEVEESSEASDIVINEDFQVVLNRKIYVEGESLDLSSVAVYSKAIKAFKEATTYDVIMPEECPNGKAYAKIVVGTKFTHVEIMYYQDAATAIANTNIEIPDDAEKYFNESNYLTNKKALKFSALNQNGNIYASGTKDYISLERANRQASDVQWVNQTTEVWTEDKAPAATLDPTKKTAPHYCEYEYVPTADESPVSGKKYYVFCENVNSYVPEYPTSFAAGVEYCDRNVTKEWTNTIYFSEQTSKDNVQYSQASTYQFEIICDGEGKICYIGKAAWADTGMINLASGEGYWSYYKDYNENPAIVLADDYNAETNPFAYEKIIPEGGCYIVGWNNLQSKLAAIDMLYDAASGTTEKLSSAVSSMTVTHESADVEASLMKARIFADTSKMRVTSYKEADTYQIYAYYYSLAAADGSDTLLAKRDEVYNALVKQLLPEVKSEPVIYSYYESKTLELLEQWAELFN